MGGERRMNFCSKKEASIYFSIRTELEEYEKLGVRITLEGERSSPDKVADECVFREDSNYMRDYVTDECGRLIEIGFNHVNNK